MQKELLFEMRLKQIMTVLLSLLFFTVQKYIIIIFVKSKLCCHKFEQRNLTMQCFKNMHTQWQTVKQSDLGLNCFFAN